MSFNLEFFFFDLPIYTPLKVTKEDEKEFKPLITWGAEINIEGYNPFRKALSTFKITKRFDVDDKTGQVFNNGFAEIKLTCKRYSDIFRFFCKWDSRNRTLIKLGQYPSVADFHINEVKQYKKLLPKEKLKEFTRAIGLSANGVGIGSFVYLRRIFEYLILDSYKQALDKGIIDEESFNNARMDEKINLLSDFLPDFLVSNKGMYSILSLGIHELDERTCLEHFDTLRVGIEIILDEKLDELRKREKIQSAQKKLEILKNRIKK